MKERFLVLKPRSRFEVNKQDTNGNAWRALVASQIALARSRLSDLNPCSNARARSCFSIPLRTQRHPQPQPPSELGLHRGWPPIRAADLCRLDAEAMLQAVATDGWDVTVRHLFAPAPTCAHDHFGHADEGRQDVMCMLEGKCTLMLMKDNIWACSRDSKLCQARARAAVLRVQSAGWLGCAAAGGGGWFAHRGWRRPRASSCARRPSPPRPAPCRCRRSRPGTPFGTA